jgi:hypothetical protein
MANASLRLRVLADKPLRAALVAGFQIDCGEQDFGH